jgi:hypothetical protein
MPSAFRTLVVGSTILAAAQGCERSSRVEHREEPLSTTSTVAGPKKAEAPALDVSISFPTTENVGAKKRIHLEKTNAAEARSAPDAWKIQFEKQGDFGGICWKNKLGNEGEAPGEDLSKGGYRRLSFWAKGAVGGEVVEFRAGGLGHIKSRYRDSFDVTAGKLRLTTTWTEYVIYVNDVDLSSVITPFCALLHREDHPGEATIYLDDIMYRG